MDRKVIENNKLGYVKELLGRKRSDPAIVIITLMKDGAQKEVAYSLAVDHLLSGLRAHDALAVVGGMPADAAMDGLLIKIAEYCLDRRNPGAYDTVLEVVRLMRPSVERNRVACALCRGWNNITEIVKVFHLVGDVSVMAETLEQAIASALENKSAFNAIGIIQLLGRKLRHGEYEAIVAACLENGRWKEFEQVHVLASKEMSLPDAVEFVRSAIKRLCLDEAFVGIKTMPDGAKKTAAILSLVEAFRTSRGSLVGNTNAVLEAIPMLSDPVVRKGAYESAIATSVEAGMYAVALRFVPRVGRRLTSDEIGTMILVNPAGHARYGAGELEMAKLMTDGTARKKIAEKMVEDFLQMGQVYNAKIAAGLCGRVLREEDMFVVLRSLHSSDGESIAHALEFVGRELTREEIGQLLG